jgi:hypothetical protein
MRIQHLAAQLVRDQTTNVGLWPIVLQKDFGIRASNIGSKSGIYEHN